jgi:hypothetical protein
MLHSSKEKRISLAAYTDKLSNIHISENIFLIHYAQVMFIHSGTVDERRRKRRRNGKYKVSHCWNLNQSKAIEIVENKFLILFSGQKNTFLCLCCAIDS